ncbi:MAG TPA: peptidase U32 family protein [Hyphomicrobiaceae bacterium]|nr:peptidase U32 family protein [Hyphomicrobiaceae bacterium]
MELVCPAGTPSALRTAVDAGADAVYCGFRDETNARNFPGLNFTPDELAQGVAYAHQRGTKVLVAINTFARAGDTQLWHRAVAQAVEAGADAIIVADLGVLGWASRNYRDQRLHLSVQAAAATPAAIRFYVERYGVKRVVLPRVLTVEEIAAIVADVPCETEVFAFGGLCVMTEGRCLLSSYATGESPNMNGVCSPAAHVDYRQEAGSLAARLGGFTIDRYPAGQPAAYPTLCKGTFMVEGKAAHIFEEPTSLNVLAILPALKAAGVSALKIEGRQRGKAYLAAVVRQFRAALDALETGRTVPEMAFGALTEGGRETTGAYRKTWR